MEYFKSLTQSQLIVLVQSTQKALYLCLPSMHKEMADAIAYLAYTRDVEGIEVGIHLLIDFDAQTFRQGYGDFQSIESLITGNFEVKTLNDNRISFIISDDTAYYLFIESRSLIPADKETINAVKVDPVSMVRLKQYFFSSAEKMNFEDELTNAIIEESKQLAKATELLIANSAAVSDIMEEEIERVSRDIKNNPPLNPDYKRIFEFYSNKFQYVSLRFEGSNLQLRKIEIPPGALPIADAFLKQRLETKLNLFDPYDDDKFVSLQSLKIEVAAIRKLYLTKVKSRDESLINKLNLYNFNSDIESLKKALVELKAQMLTEVDLKISEARDYLLFNLIEFIDEIHWPKADILMDEIKLEVKFSDITLEDLRNPQFVSELKNAGLITDEDENQLAEFSKGFKVE